MNNITPCEEYCQDLEKLCTTGMMTWEHAYYLLRKYFYKQAEFLDKAIDIMGKHLDRSDKIIETNTEFGNIKPEDFSQKESEVL